MQVSGADRSVSGPVGSSDAGGATGSMSAVAAAAAAGAVVATGTLLPAKPGVALLEIFELP